MTRVGEKTDCKLKLRVCITLKIPIGNALHNRTMNKEKKTKIKFSLANSIQLDIISYNGI